MKTGWKQDENGMKTGWKLDENRMKTEWKQDENRMKTGWKKDEKRMKTEWKKVENRCGKKAEKVETRSKWRFTSFASAFGLAQHIYNMYSIIAPGKVCVFITFRLKWLPPWRWMLRRWLLLMGERLWGKAGSTNVADPAWIQWWQSLRRKKWWAHNRSALKSWAFCGNSSGIFDPWARRKW